MKNYILKSVLVQLDNNDFVKQIPTELLKDKNLYIIPSLAFDVLNKELKDKDKNNYTYVNAYLNIIKKLYSTDGQDLAANLLKKITREYNSIIELLFENKIIKFKLAGYYDKKQPELSYTGSYTMASFNDFVFISLTEQDDTGIVELDFRIDELKNTPLNNDTFINTLMHTKIYASEAILAEYNECNRESGFDYVAFISRVNAILSFLKYRYANKGDNVDRVYSSFSGLSKVARQFLTINGKPFYEIDITNCQPLLLNCLLSENGYNIDLNYISDTVNGVFYEVLVNKLVELGYTEQTIVRQKNKINTYNTYYFTKSDKKGRSIRDQIKELSYSRIFFASDYNKSPILEAFKVLYPLVFKALKELTVENTLAHLLQNLEADIVLNIIPKCSYFTIHDAICVSNKTELEWVKTELAKQIKLRSGGRIKNVKFKQTEDYKIELLDSNNINVTETIIKAKASKLTRADHSGKLERYEEFEKLMMVNFSKQEIADKLNISIKTVNRYVKTYNDNQYTSKLKELKSIEVEILDESLIATRADYKKYLNNPNKFPYAFISSRDFKINQDAILDELFKTQAKKDDIKLTVKRIINNNK